MDVTALLARFIRETRYEDIPERVRHEARRALVNVLGCAIGSGGHETVERAVRALAPFFGSPHATLTGRKERADLLHAALINGIAAHVLDFDDTHPNAIHPSAPVWPALIALGEQRHLGGRALLHAFIVGAEVELRIGNAVFPAHYERGYHATGTCGVFGAAAATAHLLKLDEESTTYALSIAATQSSGLREMFGSDCKSLHPGKAARDGLTAALLASNGFTSSKRGIEAPRGFANVLSTAHDYSAISSGLGSQWEIGLNMYKPFACGLVVHAAIDGCIELRNTYDLRASPIEHVTVRVSPMVMELTAKTEPKTGLEGKFSIYHACAIAIIRGRAGETEFGDAAVLDAEVVALRRKVKAIPDTSIAMMEAHVTIGLSDGRILEHHVKSALGSVERPMSDRDLEAKFHALVEGVLPKPRADELINACWHADECEDAGTIARLCATA
jgi:2-methylcitrate dehydratase PrpD